MNDLSSQAAMGESSGAGTDDGPLLPNTAFVNAWRSTTTLQALRRLLDLSTQVPAAIAQRADLSLSEMRALELLTYAPHGMVELARELGVSVAASSMIVDRLQSRGHAVRRPHPSDGRRTQVHLTDSGREEVLGYLVPMFASLVQVDAALDQTQREAVDSFLDGCIEAIRHVL